MTTSPASVHGHALALVSAYRVNDIPAVACLLAELDGPEQAGEVICSLVQLVIRVLDEKPADSTAWIADALLRLAQAEAGGPVA